MAQITASTSEKVFQIKAWSGLHESPDGDTKLKLGEAASMVNFRITRDGNLQRRPGTKTKWTFGSTRVGALWAGYANGKEVMLAAADNKVYSLWDDTNGVFYENPIDITAGVAPAVSTNLRVTIYGFENKVYINNHTNLYAWDGTHFDVVGDGSTYFKPYVPLVAVSIEPSPNAGMGGELLEQVNKLSAWRRVWLSPDGTGKVFNLPEKGIVYDSASDVVVTNLGTNTVYTDTTDYTVDKTNGTITFNAAPSQAANGIEVKYHMSTDHASSVKAMRFAEIFSGMTDSRVFLYGDGTNKVFYSSIDYWGQPRGDYFPDLNEAAIGDENTPVTALIRHYSKLVAFKSDSAWNLSFDTVTLADGNMTEALYIYPTNKNIGHSAPGQIALVLNAPRTLFGHDIYEWRNNNSYSANLSIDERQAKRISDRVYNTLKDFDFSLCGCWDDNYNQEFYVYQYNTKKALVHNYAVDAWYVYDNLEIYSMCSFKGKLYFGTRSGGIKLFDDFYNSDDGDVINSYWESGNMSFNADYMRKYSARMWIGTKPQSAGKVNVTVQTDRKVASNEKVVISKLATLANVNFGDWSFNTDQQPKMKKLKLKAKKFVYYKLIFYNDTIDTSAIITSADIRVRFTGDAK